MPKYFLVHNGDKVQVWYVFLDAGNESKDKSICFEFQHSYTYNLYLNNVCLFVEPWYYDLLL